jgi:hypothetical protein
MNNKPMNQPVNNKLAFFPFSVIVVFLALMVIGVALVPLLDVRFKPSRNFHSFRIA